MEWEKPRIAVIEMNAEIGSYQADFDDEPFRGLRLAHEKRETEQTPGSMSPPADE